MLPSSETWPLLPECDPGVEPQRGTPIEPAAPVPGPVSLEVVGRVGGVAGAATLIGDQMFVGAGPQVAVVDLRDPRNPLQVALSEPLPGTIRDIELIGELLLVAAGDGGIAVLDSDRLSLISTLGLPGHAEALVVEGDVAYVADGPGGLRIVDLSDPTNLVEIGSLLDLHRIVDVAVAGDRAYLAAADEGLIVVDVGDPTSPQELGRLFTGGYAYGVAMAGDRVLLADGWEGLQVIDASAPHAPRLVTTVATPTWALDVRVEADRAFLAAGNDIRVLDLADPSLPRDLADIDFSPSAGFQSGGQAMALDVSGGRVVVVDGTVGVRILDVGGDRLALLSTFAPVASARGLAVIGDRAFLAALGQGLRIIDISDPKRPTELSGIGAQDAVLGATAVGSNLFFSTGPGIVGLDTAGPELDPQPRNMRVPGRHGGRATAVDGSLLLVATETGVLLADGGDAELCELAHLDTASEGFHTEGISVAGDYAYISHGGDIRVADVSDLHNPVLLPPSGDMGHVTVNKSLAVGRQLYTIGGDGELGIFDLADPTAPRITGSLGLPTRVPTQGLEVGPQLAYAAGRLFVADGTAGLVVVDVSDPTRPVIAGRLGLPGSAVGVVVVGDRVYVASDGGGFFVVEWSEGEQASALGEFGDAQVAHLPAHGSGMVLASLQSFPVSLGSQQTTATCLVTSTDDSGPDTLRACLEQARPGTVIGFDPAVFPSHSPATIRVDSRLPDLVERVTIDGSGVGVVLDGSNLPESEFDEAGGGIGEYGLLLQRDNVVRGLTITGFSGTGIVASDGNTIADNVVSGNGQGIFLTGSDNRVVGNLVGLDPSGTEIWARQRSGVGMEGMRNTIGGTEPADRNVISGHQIDVGVNGSFHTIQGNYIGTDLTGRIALPKQFGERFGENIPTPAIWLDGAAHGVKIAGNVVVGGDVLIIDPGTSYNELVGNILGLDATGTRALGGSDAGPLFVITGEPFNRIEGNIGEFVIGLGAGDIVVLGNHLGVDVNGEPLATGREGGRIVSGRPRAIIGGRSPTAGNVIVGEGIEIRGGSTTVIGNWILATSVPCGASEQVPVGIRVAIGGRDHLIANLVESASGIGILLSDTQASVIRGNILRGNGFGVVADSSSEGAIITGNSFDSNRTQARDEGSGNLWDDGSRGNYWSDLDGVDVDGDGVFDQSREVPPEGLDRYPLVQSLQ